MPPPPPRDTRPQTVRLARARLTEEGRALLVRPGDTVLAVDHKPFTGDAAALARMFAEADGPLPLTLGRGPFRFTLMARTAALGRWESCAADAVQAQDAAADAAQKNWMILRDQKGTCDLFSLQRSQLALFAPVVWLMHMRLWMTLATLGTALTAAAFVSPLLAVGVHVLTGLHLWRQSPVYVRAERTARGMWPAVVLAAASEAEAMAAFRRMQPESRFLFERAGARPAVKAPETQAARAA